MTQPTPPRAPLGPLGPLLGSLGDLLGQITRTMQSGAPGAGDDDLSRRKAAAHIDQLDALVAQIDRARPQNGLALIDLTQLRGALAALSQALRTPASSPNDDADGDADGDAGADAEQAIARLRALVAPLTGDDPVREAAVERERIRKQASDAIDDYFRANPLTPFKG